MDSTNYYTHDLENLEINIGISEINTSASHFETSYQRS